MKSTASRASAVSQTRGFGDLLYDKAGARPSLDLDFAGTSSLRDKITGEYLVDHTRASTGTYIDSEGLVKTSLTNIIPNSNDLSANTWNSNHVTITANAIAAPDGTLTATSVLPNTTNSIIHNVSSYNNLSVDGTGTVSVYAKANGINYVNLRIYKNADNHVGHVFNLTGDGNVTDTEVDGTDITNYSSTIENVGDGWYRLSVTFTLTGPFLVSYELSDSGTPSYNIWGGVVYGGNTSQGIYLWGAQGVKSSQPETLIKTGSTAGGAPRFTHERVETGNLLLNSQNLHYWWIATNSFVAGRTLAPDGTYSATVFGSDGSGHDINIRPVKANGNPGITLKPNTTYTYSIYAKLESGSAPTSGNILPTLYGQGVVPFNGNLTTEWKRFSTTFTTGTGSLNQAFYTGVNANTTAEIAYWGAQLEENDAASTYVPSIDTFTSRASSATYVDSAGLVKTAPVNIHVNHKVLNGTTGSDTIENPEGVVESINYISNVQLNHRAGQTGGNDGTFMAGSIYMRTDQGTATVQLDVNDRNNTIETVTDQWQRFSVVQTTNSGTSFRFFDVLTNNDASNQYGYITFGNGGSSKIYVWGIQVEKNEVTDLIKTTGTATGNPRYSHDPETLTPTGLYLEPQGINYAATQTSYEYTYSDITAPDGSNNILDNPSDSLTKFIGAPLKNYTPVDGQTVTVSYWAKHRDAARSNHTGIGRNKVRFQVRKWASSQAATVTFYYDITTQTIISSQTTAGTTTTFKPYPNGWYRISHTFVTDSVFTTNTNILFYQYQGGASVIHADLPYVWGFQYEVGSSATSYIPNPLDSTSSVTRAADVYTSAENLTETFEPRGLLIEEARTNLATKSHLVGDADANGDWQRDGSRGSTPSNPNYTNPMGTTEGLRTMQENGNNSVHNMYHINNPLDGTAKCTTVFVKPLRDDRDIQLRAVGIGGNSPVTTFDAHKGIITMNLGLSGTTNGGVGWTMGEPFIKEYANGWYRIGWTNLAMTSLGTSGWKFGIYLVPKGNTAAAPIYQGTDEDSFSCWGVQYEEGSFPTSYIHNTTTSSLNRSADIASISGDNFGTYRTNYIPNNYGNSAGTENQNISRQYKAALGYDGQKFSATKVTKNDSSGVNQIRYSPTGHPFTWQTQYLVYTTFVKLGTPELKFFHIRTNSGPSGGAVGQCVDITTNAITTGYRDGSSNMATPPSFTVTSLDNGWKKIVVGFENTTNTGNVSIMASRSATDTTVSNIGDFFYVDREQIEKSDSTYKATNIIENIPTFTSRLGNATYVDSNGLIKNSVVNLFPRSQPTSSSHWDNVGGAVGFTGNYATAPDGTQTAGRLTMPNAGFTYFRKTIPVVAGKTYTFSVYLKSNHATLNETMPQVAHTNISGGSVELVTLTDEWVRYVRTFTATTTENALFGIDNGPRAIDHLVWGFQLEEGNTATEYIPTLSNNVGGAPRYSHDPETLVPTGLYLEPETTNYWHHSNLFTFSSDNHPINGMYVYRLNMEANSTIAPDGTLTAVSVIPKGNLSNQNYWMQQAHGRGNAGATFSCFIKYNGWRYVALRNGHFNESALFDVLNGTVVYTTDTATAKIESYPNGWYRISCTNPSAGGGWSSIVFRQNDDVVTQTPTYINPNDGVSGVYLWGIQQEENPYPTSVIIASGNDTTRPADTYTSAATQVLDRDGGNKEAFWSPFSGATAYHEHNRDTKKNEHHSSVNKAHVFFLLNDNNSPTWDSFVRHDNRAFQSRIRTQAGYQYQVSEQFQFANPIQNGRVFKAISSYEKNKGHAYTTSDNYLTSDIVQTEDTSVDLFIVNDSRLPNNMSIGQNSTGIQMLNKPLRRLTFWKVGPSQINTKTLTKP